MPVEKDDEATTFDPKPWGAMQRLLPNARFAVLRTSGPLQAGVAAIEPLVRAPARRLPPIRRPQAAMTMAIPVVPAPRPLPGMPPSHTPMMAVSHAAPMMTMAMPLPMSAMPMPMPSMPHAFSAEVDCTLRVRRRPLTARSMIAAPVGALFAALVIVIAMAASGRSGSAPAASIRMNTSEQPALPVLAPPPPPVAAAAAVAAAPETAPEAELSDDDFVILEDEPQAASSAEPNKRTSKRVRRGKPRKIVAVDASTPLGNLRPGRF
jgi:hypothetical protein